ncbi:Regulatory-associated protein of TOR 1 [Morella rubra]|uniref:Regulatory-associated protein of TOR 1 n=1 Tax=Morella rubra TaxID=262757 RepID=A0A6A1WH21_9ROSI|nr:Regulatory-associated protein of TOR 1 [Morella rubra]
MASRYSQSSVVTTVVSNYFDDCASSHEDVDLVSQRRDSETASSSHGNASGSTTTSLAYLPHNKVLSELRHEAFEACVPTGPSDNGLVSKWRPKERMKTGCVSLVLCLNISVDPPDVIKISPCARMECWIGIPCSYVRQNPFSMAPQKALETIGKTLSSQYDRWQPRARYKYQLDPTVEEVKKLCNTCRKSAKTERVLFHYNGHGVPKPTANGEIWLFNRSYTQYIPLPISDLDSWLKTPSIYVFDCSAAGMIVNAFNEVWNSVLWFCKRSLLRESVDESLIDKIPGRQNDRKTLLGELNWIFTAVTDTIAWNVLPHDLFQRLFRQDLLVASLFRNFLLAERIMRSANCSPISQPMLPPTHQHHMWDAWDMAAEICLAQLPSLIEDPTAEFLPSPFFSEQLTAFEVWLDHGSEDKKPPEQLPIVLQVLLSQCHRFRALVLLGRFLDMGPWAVDLALSVGIFPYVLKLLQTTTPELRQILVFIWTKILALDKWLCLCMGKLWEDFTEAQILGLQADAPAIYATLLSEPQPEVRACAVFALGTLLDMVGDSCRDGAAGDDEYDDDEKARAEISIVRSLLTVVSDGSPLVRAEVAVGIEQVVAKPMRTTSGSVRPGEPTTASLSPNLAGLARSSSWFDMNGGHLPLTFRTPPVSPPRPSYLTGMRRVCSLEFRPHLINSPDSGLADPLLGSVGSSGASERSLLPQSTIYNWSCGYFSKPLLTASDDSEEMIARREEREKFALEHIAKCQHSSVSKLNNNNQIASWDTKFETGTKTTLLHPFSPIVIAADENERIRIWNYEEAIPLNSFDNHDYPEKGITKLCLVNELDDSLLLAASGDGNIRIWKDYNRKNKQKLVTAFSSIQGHKPGVRSLNAVVDWQQQSGYLAASQVHGGQFAAGFVDASVRLYDVRTPEMLVCEMRPHMQNVERVVGIGYHLDLILQSASQAGDIQFLDTRNHRDAYLTINAHRGSLTALAIHRHAPIIASGSAKQLIKVFSLEGEQLGTIRYLHTFMGQKISSVSCLTFHPYQVLLAAGAVDG